MSRRTFSIILAAALVGGVFAAAPARAESASEATFFLRSPGCPATGSAASEGPDTLSIVDADEEIECFHTASGIRNEIGATTGTVAPNDTYVISGREHATRVWDTVDGVPVALDVSRPVSGEIFTAGGCGAVSLVPCSPVGLGAGEVILDMALLGTTATGTVELATQTDTFQVTPGDPHMTKLDMKLDPSAAGMTFTAIELHTWIHGKSVGWGIVKTNGAASSFITIPTAAADDAPGKSDPPGKGKKKGCAKGKGKKKGACPGRKDDPGYSGGRVLYL